MKVPIDRLVPHPLNKEIYNLSDIDSLVDSISQVGMLVPLTIDQHFQVISGNRRLESIKRLGWKEVEVKQIKAKKEDEVILLIHFNKQRTKTVKELLGEYDYLKKYYKTIRNGNIRNIREVVAEDIKITDGQLARLLFIRKHNPEMIDLIDRGIMTVNQSYLQSQRSVKEQQTLSGSIHVAGKSSNNNHNFRFYLKSSEKMDELSDGEVQL